VNLEHYCNTENVKKYMYYTPKDKGSDIKMIKVVAKITVRPSGSKVTSNAEFDNVKF